MLVALSLAVLLGGAIGWLLHRTVHSDRVQELRQALARQHNQLNQAQSEIAMLSDDYDEMHRRTQEELEALRQDNQQIPFLNTNLEKSQLLVRQMMQKHEARVRDLTTENQTLSSRLKSIEAREQAYNTVQAELDSRRREKNRLAGMSADGDASALATQAAPDRAPNPDRAADTVSSGSMVSSNDSQRLDNASTVRTATSDPSYSSTAATSALISNAKPSGSWASAPLTLDTTVENAGNTADDTGESADNTSIEIDADADPFDNVMEVGDDLQRELIGAPLDFSSDDDSDETNEPGRNAAAGSITQNDVPSDNGQSTQSTPTTEIPESYDDASRQAEQSSASTASASTEQLDFELSGSDDETHNERLLDGSVDASSLFEPVEQRDDLQQIFGIGPVTEKALNDMGITSYAQLAKLKHHEIQSIADTLRIVPGRIERDDWMGNARRQLEDVLEQL